MLKPWAMWESPKFGEPKIAKDCWLRKPGYPSILDSFWHTGTVGNTCEPCPGDSSGCVHAKYVPRRLRGSTDGCASNLGTPRVDCFLTSKDNQKHPKTVGSWLMTSLGLKTNKILSQFFSVILLSRCAPSSFIFAMIVRVVSLRKWLDHAATSCITHFLWLLLVLEVTTAGSASFTSGCQTNFFRLLTALGWGHRVQKLQIFGSWCHLQRYLPRGLGSHFLRCMCRPEQQGLVVSNADFYCHLDLFSNSNLRLLSWRNWRGRKAVPAMPGQGLYKLVRRFWRCKRCKAKRQCGIFQIKDT